MSKLHFRYVYEFYSFGELLSDDIIDEEIETLEGGRFTLHQQEDGSFQISAIREDNLGKYCILTYPNKDNILIRAGESCELTYDEYYSEMGDDNHNVYVGTVTFED